MALENFLTNPNQVHWKFFWVRGVKTKNFIRGKYAGERGGGGQTQNLSMGRGGEEPFLEVTAQCMQVVMTHDFIKLNPGHSSQNPTVHVLMHIKPKA